MDILLVDDDVRVARLAERALVQAGHSVTAVHDGLTGRGLAERSAFDLLVLNTVLPDGDGFEITRELRRQRRDLSILLLTPRDALPDRARCQHAGADQYLAKPFSLEELLACVRSVARRTHAEAGDVLQLGDLRLYLDRHEVQRGDRWCGLTTKECDLLACLMRGAGRVLSKEQILDHVWGWDSPTRSNVVEIYIHYLRGKIDRDAARPPLIRTMRGVGYTIRA